MKISQDTVVSLNFTMFDDKGRLIEANDKPIIYLHGGYDDLFAPLEHALENCISGDTVRLTVSPDEAFGPIEPDLIRQEDISLFPEDIEIGMLMETRNTSTGSHQQFRIVHIDKDKVTVDGNHPLAGMAIRFEATVLEIRAATPDEIEHGYVQGFTPHQAYLH